MRDQVLSEGSRVQSVWEGKMIRRNVGHARCHSIHNASSSIESALPTPSIPVGERSRYESWWKAFNTEDRPAKILCRELEVINEGFWV